MSVYRGEIIIVEEFGTRPRSEVFADLMELFLGRHAKLLLEQDAKKAEEEGKAVS